MRIGLVADIHNDADSLSRALVALEARGIDLLVSLGDTCDVFVPEGGIVEVAAMLQERARVGVWGNHDFVLCRDVDNRYRSRYVGKYRPRLHGRWYVADLGRGRLSFSAISSRLATRTTSSFSGR